MKVEGAGVELNVAVRGEGPAVVVVHGMGGSADDFDIPAARGRVVTYERRGYGSSSAPEPYTRTTVNEQAEDLADVIRALEAAPALLVGADLGALAIIDVLLRHRGLARAAVLIDPPLYAFVPEATEALSDERALLEDALRHAGPASAVVAWLGSDVDDARRERAAGSARAFFADYGAVATLPLTRAELRSIDVPLRVVTSEGARPHVIAAARALLEVSGSAVASASLADALDELA